MLKLAATVRDSALRISRDVTVEIDEGKPVSTLIAKLVSVLGWPMEYMDGRPLNYYVHVDRLGRVLENQQPVAAAGLLEGDILVLAPAIGAAAAPPRPVDKPPAPESSESDGGATISMPRASLQVLSGPGAGTSLRISRGETTIGRGEGCDLRVAEDRAVSRNHCTVVYVPPDFWLVDTGSANGTRLNGVTISRERLPNGATITVGSTTIAFKQD